MRRVVIVARSVVMRAGLESVLTNNSNLSVVGNLAGIDLLASSLDALNPEVVLVVVESAEDLSLLLAELESEKLLPALVLLTDDLPAEAIAEALRAGVRAILPSEAIATELVAAVEAAAAGLLTLHPDLANDLFTAIATPARTLPETETQPLSPREIEVLQLLAEGLGNKAIARRLYISEHTVKYHISSLFTKLHAASRTEAVMLGARQGLVVL